MSLFVRLDLSQAEDRLVKVLSHDAELIELAHRPPWEFDAHKFNANIVFGIPESRITKRERQAGKRIVHLTNYDGQPKRASEALLEEGFDVSEEECARGRELYHQRFPGIKNGYHLRTRMLVIQQGYLEGANGFRIEFKFERRDQALWRRAYAWRPQHFIGNLLNQWGVIPAYEFINRNALSSRIRFQVHDEIAISCPDSTEGWDLARAVSDSLQQEGTYEGTRLSIPAELAIEWRYHGRDESEAVEWKRFPDAQTFKEEWRRLESEQRKGK